jgi:hypothetical protein
MDKPVRLLVAVVLVHLGVTFAHGAAHAAAGVNLGPAAFAFVIVVIEFAPLAGLVWMRTNPRRGARLVAVTMVASLLFGLVNHFVIPGADRVDHVVASSRVWFETTAGLLVATEALAAILGIACGWRSIGAAL